MEDVHGFLNAPAARGVGATRQGEVVREVVEVSVGSGAGVCDSVGVAVHVVIRSLKAGGLVHHLVRLHAVEELLDNAVSGVPLLFAVVCRGQVLGCRVKELGAVGDIGGAGLVENTDNAEELLLGVEEATGCLEHHGERVASLKRRVGEDAIEKRGAVAVCGSGEFCGQVSVKGLGQR